MKPSAVAVIAPPASPSVTPMHMLQLAVEKGADLDQLQKFMDLADRWQASEARKAYVAAMADFKADPPTIVKNKLVAFGNTRYNHATHDEVTNKIAAALAAHGLSHSWHVDQSDAKITVTCVVTHIAGHSESVVLSSPADTSGQKNAIQAIASAITYLQRYTLLAITGLSTSEMSAADTDGHQQKPKSAEPPGFDAWWKDLKEAANKGSAALMTNTSFASTGCSSWAPGIARRPAASAAAWALAWRALPSHRSSPRYASSCALRNRSFDQRWPDCLRRRSKSRARRGSKNTTASAARAPFLVAPSDSTSTPARQVSSPGLQPRDATALAKRAPSMCRPSPARFATEAIAATSPGS